MKNFVVSIIVPVYNVENYLDECISSIVNQTYPFLNIILVNDGSSDNSLEVCKKWARKDSRINLIDQENQGVSRARNAGLESAIGDYILFIDSDDIIDLAVVEQLISNVDQYVLPGIAIDTFSEVINEPDQADNMKMGFRQLMNNRNGYFCWGILYNSDIIRSHNLKFDEDIGNLEDVVWNIKYGAYIEEAILVNTSFYHYRNREKSITTRCHDYLWQVESWLKVIKALQRFPTQKGKEDYFKLENKRCKNNVYAELYYGKISWKKFLELTSKNGNRSNFNFIEYCIYKLLFLFEDIKKILFK